MKTKALLLVGHGSSFGRDSSQPVYRHAARIREQRLYDEVHVAFWKERPWIRDALGRIDCDDVHVVPMFLAEGYFTRTVVPRELGSARAYHLHPPIGVHPRMAELVLERAAGTGVNARRATLIVIGHGTERSATSSNSVLAITHHLRASSDFGDVRCGFIDQSPRIETVLADTEAAEIVLVPYFMADGWHVRETIPASLGLTGSRTEREGRAIWYTQAVGTLPEIAGLISISKHHTNGNGRS
ncbi:MAG: CbiX/SirB N-terminal domain-containing protein [Gemmatimonadota bacterium]